MKKMCKFVVFVLLVSMLLCHSISAVSAAQEKEEDAIGTLAISNSPIYRVDMEGNYYGRSDWPTINDAKNHYGWDHQYGRTACIFGDEFFNYYYWFEDGTKCFFGVLF